MNKNFKLAGAGVLALALLGGGIGIGTAVADPTTSEEYAAVSADRDEQKAKVAQLDSGLDASQDRTAELLKDLQDARARESELKTLDASLTDREKKAADAESAVKKREDAVKVAETAKAASSITDGSWTVGRTVEPGTYTTERAITGSCYWEITTSGTNGDDIVANDNVSGGQPTVTLAVNQDFKSSRCGTWVKLG
ncbi:hypothetical protein [Arthrobacter sp. CP30]